MCQKQAAYGNEYCLEQRNFRSRGWTKFTIATTTATSQETKWEMRGKSVRMCSAIGCGEPFGLVDCIIFTMPTDPTGTCHSDTRKSHTPVESPWPHGRSPVPGEGEKDESNWGAIIPEWSCQRSGRDCLHAKWKGMGTAHP